MTVLPVGQVAGDLVSMARTNAMHLGVDGKAAAPATSADGSFEQAMIKAMDGVNAKQMDASEISQRMLTDPDSVDAHDVTIAQAEASLSLNIARTVLDRVVRGWKEVINAR